MMMILDSDDDYDKNSKLIRQNMITSIIILIQVLMLNIMYRRMLPFSLDKNRYISLVEILSHPQQ